MSNLRIKDAPLLPNLLGNEKIPTGGRGNFTTTPDQLRNHIANELQANIDSEINRLDAVDTMLLSQISSVSLAVSQNSARILPLEAKVSTIATGATANATNAQLRSRDTHTGVQPINTVSGLQMELGNRAPLIHTHPQSSITGLVGRLDTIDQEISSTNTILSGRITAIEQKNIDYDKIVTVGAVGADFTTINDALNELSRYNQLYVKTNDASNSKAKILLKSGFVAAEQININGVDFGWVDIVSEDVEVVISRAALTVKIGRWYSFIRCKSGTIPSIKTLFRMDTTGVATERVALYMINSVGFIEVGAGFKDAAVRAIDLTQTSSLCASGGIFTGAGALAIRPATGSSAFLQFADLSNSVAGLSCGSGASVAAEGLIARNCATTAVEVQGGCNVELSDSDLSGSGSFGLYISKCSVIGAANLTIDGAAGYGVFADNGASVDLSSATIRNCTGVAGVRATNGAHITANGVTATGNNINLMATKGGVIVADSGILTGATSIGIAASEGGSVIANNSNYRKNTGDSTTDCSVSAGGRLFLQNTTGGVPQKTDVQLPAGIIYRGVKTRSRGQAAIVAGTTSVVVTHTLSELPITIATPISPLGVATKWWLSNVGTTTFQINIDAATASAVTFHWSCDLV